MSLSSDIYGALIAPQAAHGTFHPTAGDFKALALIERPTFNTNAGGKIQLTGSKADFGAYSQVQGLDYATGMMPHYMSPPTAAGEIPLWGELMRAAGFTETVVADTSVTYQHSADSANHEEFSLIGLHDRNKLSLKDLKVTGLRFVMSVGQSPRIEVDFQANNESRIDAAPVGVTATFVKPVIPGAGNLTVSAFGATRCVDGVTVDFSIEAEGQGQTTCDQVTITDMKPKISFSALDKGITDYDWVGQSKADATGAVTITLGTEAGKIIELATTGAEFESVDSNATIGKRQAYGVSLSCPTVPTVTCK